MSSFARIARPVGAATLGNAAGSLANVLMPLVIISYCGANRITDNYFLILAIGFYFYGTLANALNEASVPLLITGELTLRKRTVLTFGAAAGMAVWAAALIGSAWGGLLNTVYATALALMAGAGIANGFAAGLLQARERYALPGISWGLRLIPLGLFILAGPTAERLAWLAVGIGAADWLRCGWMLQSAVIADHGQPPANALKLLRRHFGDYAAVVLSMLIVGWNPID